MSERHLIFAPHPDDELIGCAAVIVRAVRAGEGVRVVLVTSGQNLLAVCAGILAEPEPVEVGRRRQAESLRSCRMLGLADGQVVFLGYEDGATARDEALVAEACRRQIADFLPTRIYCTSAWDAHPDHRAVCRAVAAARAAAGCTAGLWQYGNRETLAKSGGDVLIVDIAEEYPLKQRAMRECASHLAVVSPHQRGPLMPDFLAVYCRREECFIQQPAS